MQWSPAFVITPIVSRAAEDRAREHPRLDYEWYVNRVAVLGVEEDEHARTAHTPGVELSDAEVARIRQIVASRVAPMPNFDVLTVPDSVTAQGGPVVAGEDIPTTRGFVVIAVPGAPARHTPPRERGVQHW